MTQTAFDVPLLLFVGSGPEAASPLATDAASELNSRGLAHTIQQPDPEQALTLIAEHRFDAVVAAWTNDKPAWDKSWADELQSRSGLPLIAIADGPEACLAALRAGAEDFILTPCRALEILARVQALLERRRGSGPHWMHFGPLTINVRAHEATVNGCLLDLTHSELTVLKCLIAVPYKTVTRDELAHALYQREASPYERSIDVHISNLRRKIEASGGVRIRSVRGVGYLLATDALQVLDTARAS